MISGSIKIRLSLCARTPASLFAKYPPNQPLTNLETKKCLQFQPWYEETYTQLCMFFFYSCVFEVVQPLSLKADYKKSDCLKTSLSKSISGKSKKSNRISFIDISTCALNNFLHIGRPPFCGSDLIKNVTSSCRHPAARQPDSSATQVTVMFYSRCEPGPFVSALVTSPANRCYIHIYICMNEHPAGME